MIEHSGLGALAPEKDADSAPFWEALTGGRLLVPRCGGCRRSFFPPMPACPRCGSTDVTLAPSEGRGTIYSWVTVHRALHEAFAGDIPYTIVAVDLDEGARMFGRLLEPSDTALAADLRVLLTPYEAGGFVLPGFRIVHPTA